MGVVECTWGVCGEVGVAKRRLRGWVGGGKGGGDGRDWAVYAKDCAGRWGWSEAAWEQLKGRAPGV